MVVEGRSHADESVLTGESAPQPKAPGDPVVCGSINTGGALDIRATRVGAESTLAPHRPHGRAGRRQPHRNRAHRRPRLALFIPAVLAIRLRHASRCAGPASARLAVLVIACPCALGIATPLALTAAVAAAGRRGILVRDTRVLETIRDVDVVVLDKTGTATTGEFTLLDAAGDTTRMAELAAIEPTPITRSPRRSPPGPGPPLPAAEDVSPPRRGITGVWTESPTSSAIAPGGESHGRSTDLTRSFGWDGVSEAA